MKKLVQIAIAGLALVGVCRADSSGTHDRVVRLAELEIDPAQLDNYKAALIEEINTSVRIEPGVLNLYAIAVKDHPARIRILEIYANTAAYKAHLETPHFKTYKTVTQGMVKSLNLVETEPIVLGSKAR